MKGPRLREPPESIFQQSQSQRDTRSILDRSIIPLIVLSSYFLFYSIDYSLVTIINSCIAIGKDQSKFLVGCCLMSFSAADIIFASQRNRIIAIYRIISSSYKSTGKVATCLVLVNKSRQKKYLFSSCIFRSLHKRCFSLSCFFKSRQRLFH